MDFGNAAMLMAALLGLVQLAKVAWKGTTEQRITVGIVVASSLVAVFLLAASVWGNEQVIGGHKLGALDVGSKLVVALFLAGGASALWETLTTAKNIGANQVQVPAALPPKPGTVVEAQPPAGTSGP